MSRGKVTICKHMQIRAIPTPYYSPANTADPEER
jgi:hypothetical protein